MANINNSTKQTPGKNVVADPAAALWRIVLTDYQRAEAEYKRLDEQQSEATSAYWAELGDGDPDFETYRVPQLHSENRQEKINKVEIAIIIRDHAGKDELSPDDLAAITKKAAILVDDYAAFRAKREEVWARTIGKIEPQWEQALDLMSKARDRLIKTTPAPDAEAMLYKLELLAAEMTDADAEDAPSVTAIRDDARRLLGGQ